MKLKIPPPIQTLIAALLMWAIDRVIPINTLDEQLKWPIIGFFSLSATIVLLLAVFGFSQHKTTVNPLKPEKASSLVIEGIYKYSRNPMYLGMACYLIAWMAWLQNPSVVIAFILYIGYITHFQIKPEEAALETKFGEEFSRYQKSVRRWI